MRDDISAAEQEHEQQPVREQLLAMLQAMIGSWSKIYLVIKQGDQIPDTKHRAEMRSRFAKAFAPVLERGRKEGLLAPDPEGMQAVALLGLMQAYFSIAVDDPRQLSAVHAAELVTDAFLHGAGRRGKA